MSVNSNQLSRKTQDIQDKAQNKLVFVVEGSDDEKMWLHWFSLCKPNWENNWYIVQAGNKKQVLALLQEQGTWFGSVDKDEWQSEKIAELSQSMPNLCILPRFCIENYLIVPDELWQAIPSHQQIKIEGGYNEFSTTLLQDLEKYLQHGVLWQTINPLWEGLRSKGFKEDLLTVEHANDSAYIQAKLQEWHEVLNPQLIENKRIEKINEARVKHREMQLCQDIHGKFFFEDVVCSHLNQWFGQKSQNKWRDDLIVKLLLPNDIQAILQKIGMIE